MPFRLVEEAGHEGYAYADGEAELGFRSIAVPLRRMDRRVVAALNAGCAAERADPETLRSRFLPRLLAEAASLRHELL